MPALPHDEIVLRVARRLIYKLPPVAHIDDLMQEGRIAVWRRADMLAGLHADHQAAAVTRLAKFAMIDWARSMWPMRGSIGRHVLDSAGDDEQEVAGSDDVRGQAQVQELIDRLPLMLAPTRLAVLNDMAAGLTLAESAAALGITESGVSWHRCEMRRDVERFVG